MAKYISLEEALALVKSGDYIVSGLGTAEAKVFMTNLHTIADRVNNVTVSNCLPMADYEFMVNPDYQASFFTESWFYTAPMRKSHAVGNGTYLFNHLRQIASKRLAHRKPNIYVGLATPPDKHGYVSLSVSNVYETAMIEAADTVILEVNPQAPRTFGDVQLHVRDIDYLMEASYPVPVLPDAEPNEKDMIIGKLIAEQIHDGDCIQLGIGGIPNAVAASLMDKNDLGIHTEMLTTGMAKLAKAGVITNKYKKIQRGKSVTAFVMGTQELYDFVDDNPGVAVMSAAYVNDPWVIAQNDNQVSINSTLEVDLFGQCCSEAIGTRMFSGTGGQSDTAIGAQMSKGGRSFIATYSTAMVKNKATGERVETSKIVSTLKPGAAVSLSRNDVDWIVTEYGAVNLRGTSMEERAKMLISVAHPKFRDQLTQEAIELGIMRG